MKDVFLTYPLRSSTHEVHHVRGSAFYGLMQVTLFKIV
jgi:hypothetical protein